MKQTLVGLLGGILLLTACGQTSQPTQSTLISVIDTATPSPIPTTTSTLPATETPTASITPLPTIPSFTPTFDVSTIVTVTPAPKAECPAKKPDIKPDFKFDTESYHDFYKQILD